MNENLIKNHYEIALNLINLKEIKKAKLELYNKMPIELYDESLDILNNRNLKFKNRKLKQLIENVHSLINDYNEQEKESNINDNNINFLI